MSRFKANHLAIASIISISSIVLAACGSASSTSSSSKSTSTTGSSSAATTVVNVAFDPNATALPAWVAQDKGIFAKNHLDVKFTKIQNLSTLPGALGNTFNIVLSTPTELLSAAKSGLPVVEVSGSSIGTPTNPTGEVMVSPTSGIHSLADLEGKSIGTLTLNGTLTYALEYDLLIHKLNPKGIKLVTMAAPTMADNLKAGNVPAVITVPPFITALKKAGNIPLLNPYDAVGSKLASIFWIGSSSWAKQHPQAIKEWVTSLDQAQTYIAQNDTAARAVLVKYTGLPEAVIKNFTLPIYNTSLRPNDLARWATVMQKLGIIANPPSISSLMVNG